MGVKKTEELEKILKNTHWKDTDLYFENHMPDLILEDKPFADYMRVKIKEKKMQKQDLFIQADIPERYGYKLLSEEKRTRQRDIILRLCYAAHFTLEEVQKALKLYAMPQLYARIPRDALLMIAFNEHAGSIIELNVMLKEQGMETLRTSGVQD